MIQDSRQPAVEPQLLTIADVAQILQISERSIWRLVSAHKIVEPIRIGKSVRWRKVDLDQWLENGCPEQASE